jgi:hypothetical protein
MTPSFRERRAFCFVEILVALAVMGLAFIPVLGLFTSSQRTGQSARRLLEASLHARGLAETAVQLRSRELPAVPASAELVVHLDAVGGGGPLLPAALATLPRPAFLTARRLTLRRLADSTLLARAEVEWDSVPGEPGSQQQLQMQAVGDAEVEVELGVGN